LDLKGGIRNVSIYDNAYPFANLANPVYTVFPPPVF